ncbi:MAG: hypothetical protein R3C61_23005 [Bacteroidia bacterium]
MLTIDPKTTPIPQLHQYLVGAVAPGPIAFGKHHLRRWNSQPGALTAF